MEKLDELFDRCQSAIEIQAIRSQGAGGQNVNKVSSAIHLRLDIPKSDLPDDIKQKLLHLNDQRINKAGVLVIKAQEFRSREKNIDAAKERLLELLQQVNKVQKKRVPTKPSRAAKQKRMDSKTKRAQIKQSRGKPEY